MGFAKEFKEFALKGNVMDLAVGVIIGGAFGKIITSMVDDLLMPIIGTFIGKDFSSLTTTINGATVKYGSFIQNTVDFLIIALVVFMMVRTLNKFKKKEEAAPSGPSSTDALLMEIRDALKKQ